MGNEAQFNDGIEAVVWLNWPAERARQPLAAA
jgi:hypothetical protein